MPKAKYLFFLFALAACGTPSSPNAANATKSSCAFSGREIAPGLQQLTGTFLHPGQTIFPMDELPDPAPPVVNAKGEVEIYGSGSFFLRYANWEEYQSAGCFRLESLPFAYPFFQSEEDVPGDPWDLRKYWLDGTELLVGGAMSPSDGRTIPLWPRDNMSRRIYFFRPMESGRWQRDENPLFGNTRSGWIDHSYGGNLIQEHATQNLRSDHPIYLFYERVSAADENGPRKTEIFARVLGGGQEIPVLTHGDHPYPAARRSIGGWLVEGARPTEVKIEGQTFFLIGFSAGDFFTDAYSMNFLWSRSLRGPFHPFLDETGDLKDFARGLKSRLGLSWVGRPALYALPGGGYQLLFHGVQKSILPDNDYRRWPERYNLWEFFRSIYRADVTLSLNPKGEPQLRPSWENASSPAPTRRSPGNAP